MDGPLLDALVIPPHRLRIAFSTLSFTGEPVHPDCRSAIEHTAAKCAALGHEMIEADPKVEIHRFMRSWTNIVACGTELTVRSREAELGRSALADELDGVTKGAVVLGQTLSGADYLDAVNTVHDIGRQVAGFLADERGFDMLLTATLAEPPAEIGRFKPDNDDFVDYRMGPKGVLAYSPFTALANGTGQPAMSVPLYWNDAGLPIGAHFMARSGQEGVLLQLAAQLEQADPLVRPDPPAVGHVADRRGLGEGDAAQRRQGWRRLLPRRQLTEELCRRLGDGEDRSFEGGLGGRRRLLHAADLADVLAGGGLDLLRRRQWLQPSECGDVAAHAAIVELSSVEYRMRTQVQGSTRRYSRHDRVADIFTVAGTSSRGSGLDRRGAPGCARLPARRAGEPRAHTTCGCSPAQQCQTLQQSQRARRHAAAKEEQRISDELDYLPAGWLLLHAPDIASDDDARRVDHLAIGPGGVFMIYVEHQAGAKVWISEHKVTINGRDSDQLRQARFEARRTSGRLTDACGVGVTVQSVLVLIGAATMQTVSRPAEVHVRTQHDLRDWLCRQPTRLDAETVQAVYDHLLPVQVSPVQPLPGLLE